MRRCLIAALVLAWTLAGRPAGAQVNLDQPLPTDPRLVAGELPDGFRYIVVRHAYPPGRAAMWINISTGSLNETDRQRGIAHFLEHMAFNGSENFPPGAVVPFFESLGMTFGRDQNAFTSFDQTAYQLSLPDARPETIAKGLKFFADVAGRLSLLPEEIEDERQVILEERRGRLSGRQRIADYLVENIAPGSRFGQRLAIGTEETIREVTPQDFRDFYSTWYIPSNMTLIVVADADPDEVIRAINEAFGKGERVPRPVDAPGGVKPYAQTRALIASDPEVRDAEVSINRVEEPTGPTITVGDLRRDLVEEIGTWSFNRRMNAKIAAGEAAFQRGGAAISEMASAIRWIRASAGGEPGMWKEMLAQLAVELQRARIHGFTERELADARAELLAEAEESVRREPTYPAGGMLGSINQAVASGRAIMSAPQYLDQLRALLPTITAPEVSSTFAGNFDPSVVTFILQAPPDIDLPTEAELIALGAAALEARPESEAEADRPDALMTAIPEPAPVDELSVHPEAQVWSAWLANGVRVNYRFMDYRKDQVIVSINLAGGPIEEPADRRGISEAAAIAWGGNTRATRSLSSTNIRDLMTGKNASVSGRAGVDTMSLSISGSPADLETGFQLAHLLLTEPKIEAAAFDNWKQRTRRGIESRKLDPVSISAEVLYPALYGDSRVPGTPLEYEDLDRLTIEDSQAWLDGIIARAPIEVGIVGDVDKETVFNLVQRYLGTLGRRERIAPDTNLSLRTLPRPQGPRIATREIDTQTPKAMVFAGCYGVEGTDVRGRRLMSVAAKVLSVRMLKRIREELQLVYSIRADSSPAVALPGFGVFMAYSPTEPAKALPLVREVDAMFSEFAREGPTEEEVETVKRQIAVALEEEMRGPRFWLGQISDMTYRDTDLSDVLADPDAYQAVTASEVQGAFGAMYTEDSRIQVTIKPRDSEGKEVEDAKAAE